MDRLTNTIRPYAWGSTTAIPALLGTEPTGEPQAELWMGAHPGAPSRIDRGTPAGPRSLSDVIAADPAAEMSDAVVDRFGRELPFLLKILAAGSPLSLQVHPDLDQARTGFADEEARGVPRDAPERNYKDANHKPEMIVALDDFDGLCGFRDPHRTADLLDLLAVPELAPYSETLRSRPAPEALRSLLTSVLSAPAAETAPVVAATATALRMASTSDSGPAREWADTCRAYAQAAEHYPGDPGVLAALLLNHARLAPGEALFLGAGVPHAYLDGLGVEVMANSDNVLRCGLTPKHIDVPELLRIVDFRPTGVDVLRPDTDPATGEQLYPAPVDDFRLSRHILDAADPSRRPLPAGRPQILLCTAGRAHLEDGATSLDLAPGESAYLSASAPQTTVRAAEREAGRTTLFRATVRI